MVNNHDFLTQMCFKGLEKRGFAANQEYIDRLKYELKIIKKGNLADFFLNTAFIILKIKSQGKLVGYGRGSCAGSLVCFCLNITEIDPIKYNLIFERFLNPTRVSMLAVADVDVDIGRLDRPDILKMIRNDFGEDKTFQVINKLSWTEKTAIKDLCRIIDIPFDISNKITKLIPDDEHAVNIPDVKVFLENHPFVRDNYLKLVGMTKTYGVHAAADIITGKSVEYYDSVVRVNGVTCLDNNGKIAESIGLLKADFLGLNTLTIISDCLKLVPNVKLPKTFNDPTVFETINNSTLGIFQFEGKSVQEVCEKIQPKNFNDLCLITALARPGALDSGETDRYINRRNGLEQVTYDHPKLEPILKNNLGCIIFQENVINIVQEFAGMSTTDGEIIRRGIGKKIQSIFDEYYPKFIQSCVDNDINKDIAEIVWQKMVASASYSFNLAHATSYSALSYVCAFLATYYPIEFFLSVLNNTEDEDKRIQIYNHVKSINSEIHNPDINVSKDTTIIGMDNKMYLGFNIIKNVGPSAVQNILDGQPYGSFEDFCNRCKVNIRVKKALIESGCFDRFGIDRDILYSQLTGEEVFWSDKEKLFKEYNLIKINPQGNLLDLYNLRELGINKVVTSVAQVNKNEEEYKDFYIKVLSSDFKLKEDYAFASVSDGFNNMSLFVANEFISRYINDLNEVGNPLLIHIHGKSGKYSLLSLINLNDIDKHTHEYAFYIDEATKKLELLQKDNPNYNVGVVSNIRPFTSKKGNRCFWYDVYINDELYLEDRIVCNVLPKMVEGSFLFFLVQDNPTFLQIIEVV